MTTFRLYTNDTTGRSIIEREIDGAHGVIHSDDDKNFQKCLSEMHKMIREGNGSKKYIETLNGIFDHCDKQYDNLPENRDKK